MGKAARAIIFNGQKILVMHRDKSGSKYYTLVGGRVQDHESLEQGVIREVREETGMEVTNTKLVFIEEHAPPYDEQYIFLCEVANLPDSITVQLASEEGIMNQIGINNHQPIWAEAASFARLPFRTPQLQAAIVQSLRKGFPNNPVKL
jgi:ADP-ribose pyrophosphatase YjhB (NUDIX family)